MHGSLRLVALALIVTTQAPPSGIRLVQVSVVVHDSRHEPVEGLTAKDFQLLDDGREVPVSVVDIYADGDGSGVEDADGIYTNHVRSPSKGGVVAVVFDQAHTSPEHRALARDHIVTYLGQVAPDDRIALYVLGVDVMQVLHDFTDDARPLLASLQRASSRKRSGPQGAVPGDIRSVDSRDAQIDGFVNGDLQVLPAFYERRRSYIGIKGLEDVAAHLAGVRSTARSNARKGLSRSGPASTRKGGTC